MSQPILSDAEWEEAMGELRDLASQVLQANYEAQR